jgi:hypothetical protein
MRLHVSSTCAHHQEVKIALHSLWYHHTFRWPSRAKLVNYWAKWHKTVNWIHPHYYIIRVKIKVKQFHYKPGQTQRDPEWWGSRIPRESAHEGGKVVSPRHLPPLLSKKYSRYSFLLESESTIVRLKGLCLWKIPVTPSRIEPVTFRLVAHWLNRMRHRVLHTVTVKLYTSYN